MKRLLLATSIGLLSLSSAAALAAPGHGHGQQDGQGQSDERGNGKDDHGKKDHGKKDHNDRNGDGNQDRHWARDDRGNRYAYGHRAHHDNGRHLGQFRRGERVPDMYMQQRYYVTDYRAYHLAPPPSGYRWVRPDDGRYLLISTATGLISQMLGY